MALSPVTAVTEFIIRLDAKMPCTKDEGMRLCTQLINWIQDPNHPDYNEAATLPFFLARKLLKSDLINRDDYKAIRKKAAEVIQQTKLDPVEKLPSPHFEICKQWNAFLQDSQATRVEGLHFFERLIQWISTCPQEEYDGSTITIFSMALDLEGKGVSSQEKEVLFNRAFQVIVKDPKDRIKDRDLVDFLRSRGFKIK